MHSREGLSTAHVKHILRSVLRNTLQLHTLCGVSLPNYRSPGSASFITTSCLQTTGTAWCLGLNRFSTGGAGSRSKCSGSMQLPARGDLTIVMLGWEEHGRSQRLYDHPLDTHCEPSALYCWILEILYCDPKGRRALLRTTTTGRAKCLPMLGSLKT